MASRVPDQNRASRVAAIAAGERTYFSGKPCPAGHQAPRYAVNGSCTECLRLRSKAQAEAKGRVPRVAKQKVAKQKKPAFVKATFVRNPVFEAAHRYSLSIEARERSRYLDGLIKNLTAKKARHDQENP
jgi:hypothetical protein